MTKVTSQKGIVFIRPTALIEMIKTLENNLPGWWWSISQKPAQIIISTGPSEHTPHAHDVVLATTSEVGSLGDTGLIHTLFYPQHKEDDYLVQFVKDIITLVDPHRVAASLNTDAMNEVVTHQDYRKQTDNHLKDLMDRYTVVLSDAESLEKPGYIFDEIYLGSCQLSVDCSLRGSKPDGSAFDFSWDIEDAILADPLIEAHAELRKDIKAFKSSQEEG